ncbi:MAG: carboxypeptidase-like regulatory domain-containing protein [Planctomycetota bacterium]
MILPTDLDGPRTCTVVVSVWNEDESQDPWDEFARTRADADGRFQLPCPPGTPHCLVRIEEERIWGGLCWNVDSDVPAWPPGEVLTAESYLGASWSDVVLPELPTFDQAEGLLLHTFEAARFAIQFTAADGDHVALGRALAGREVVLGPAWQWEPAARGIVDDAGRLEVGGLPPGTWQIYERGTEPGDISLRALSPLAPFVLPPEFTVHARLGSPRTIEVPLVRGRRIQGRVTDGAGEPVPHVHVAVEGHVELPFLLESRHEYPVYGDAAGRVDGLIPPMRVDFVQVSADDHGSVRARGSGAERLLDRLATGELRLESAAERVGTTVTLRTRDGAPVQGQVGIEGSSREREPLDEEQTWFRKYATDAEGVARPSFWRPTDGVLRAHGTIEPGESGATSRLVPIAEAFRRERASKTPPETWYAEQRVSAASMATGAPIDLVLAPAPRVALLFEYHYGDPVDVTKLAFRPEWDRMGKPTPITIPSPTSRLTLTLPPGRHVFFAEAARCLPRRQIVYVPETGGTAVVRLQEISHIDGKVVDSKGRPAPFVPVVCEKQWSPAQRTTTNAEGRFTLWPTATGEWFLTARRDAEVACVRLVIEDGPGCVHTPSLWLQEPGDVMVRLPLDARDGADGGLEGFDEQGRRLRRIAGSGGRFRVGGRDRIRIERVSGDRCTLQGWLDGSPPLDVEVGVTPGGVTTVDWPEGPAPPPLVGRIVAGSSPVHPCTVALVGFDGRTRAGDDVAADGRYEFPGGFEGPLRIEIGAPMRFTGGNGAEFDAFRAQVAIEIDESSGDLGDIVLPTGSLHGTVGPSSQGWRFDGATVMASPGGSGDERTAPLRNGRWEMRFLEPGRYEVFVLDAAGVQIPGVRAVTVDVQADRAAPAVHLR